MIKQLVEKSLFLIWEYKIKFLLHFCAVISIIVLSFFALNPDSNESDLILDKYAKASMDVLGIEDKNNEDRKDLANAQVSKTPTPIPTEITVTDTPFPTPTLFLPTNTPTSYPLIVVPVDSDSLFDKYGNEYDVSRNLLSRIAWCESGFNVYAVNGPYAGMYQFTSETWISVRATMGMDTNPDLRLNAEESVRTAAFKISRDGTSAWPSCSR